MSIVTNESVLSALRTGDAGAIEFLVTRHGPGLHRFLMNRVRNEAMAEDLLQEVWRQALEGHRRVRDPEKLVGWLYGIARNVALSSRRKTRREVPLERLTPGDEDSARESLLEDREAPDPRAEAHAASLRGTVSSLLNELDDQTREMITLRFYDGLTTGQISEVLEVPLGTVCSKVHRGLKRLRRALERDGVQWDDLS